MSSVTVDDVGFAVRGRVILAGLSLSVPPGEMLAVIGPNGAGKSTLLRVVAGILRPGTGRVLLGERPVASLRRPEVARRLAYLPQDTWTGFGITVEEAVALGRFAHLGRWRGMGLADWNAVEAAMERLEVAHLSTRSLPTLSGGERQRVFLARALAQEAPVLVLDEPTTALDIGHQLELVDLLQELHAEGRTIICAVHDLQLVWRSFPRSVLLGRGRLVRDGPTRDVLTGRAAEETFGVRFLESEGGEGLRCVR